MDIRKLIEKQKNNYKSIVSIYCPLLNDTIYFTSEGFYHLISKSNGKRRKVSEQYLKLKCFDHVPTIIQKCNRIIETRKEEYLIKGKKKFVTSYELIDEQKRSHHISVIINKIGMGKLKFRSVKRISNSRFARSKKAPFGA